MSGWKTRAQPVESAGSWRDRAQREAPLKFGRRTVTTTPGPEADPFEVRDENEHTKVSAPIAGALGFGQGITFGGADEIAAGVGAAANKIEGLLESLGLNEPEPQIADQWGDAPERPDFGDDYRQQRDSGRELNSRASDQHPVAFTGGEIAGDLLGQAGLAIATGGQSLTPQGQFLVGAGSGTLRSQGDLTRGNANDFERVATDAAVGGVVSGALAKGGQALGGWLRERGARGVAAAEQLARDKAGKVIDAGIDSARGAYGSAVQKGSRILENADRLLESAPDDLRAVAERLTRSGEAQSVKDSVLRNSLDNLPDATAGIDRARRASEALVASRERDVAEKAAELLSNPVRKQIWPRVSKYMSRMVPPLASGVIGGAVGGIPGAALGALGGGGVAALMGSPGTALANAMQSPAVKRLLWSTVRDTLSRAPERLGKFAGAFARAESPEALDAALSRQDPEYQALKMQLLNDALAEQEAQDHDPQTP